MTLRPPTVQILVLQSTAFCNIDCTYCYLPDRGLKGTMSLSVVERVADQIVASERWAADSLLLWHAGEPMTCSPDWYRAAHSILARRAKAPLRIQFQTNGTLLDDRWVRLLEDSHAWVGFSIDGPRALHDSHRKDKRGLPTFDRVMHGVDLVRRAGIPFTAIAVVTEESLDRPDEIFAFFDELRPQRLAFSIEEAEGANDHSSLYRPDLLARVERFFERIATLNFRQREPLRVREVEQVLAGLVHSRGVETSQETKLGWIVAVGAKGDVAFFSPELLTTRQGDGHYASVGNLLRENLDTVLASARLREQAAAIALGVERCRKSCAYFAHCGGGSPANKYFETGGFDASETWYCRVAKQATVRGVVRAIAASRGSGPSRVHA